METRIILIIILFFSVCCLDAQNLDRSKLDNYITNILKQDKLPGLSIAIVLNDSVIYAKGFGVIKTGEKEPVNEHTLYEAVSLTKTFTATLIGILVDQGKISWTGLSPGTSNLISFIPSKKIGIAIQSNVGQAFSSFVLINSKIFDGLIFNADQTNVENKTTPSY